jgi:molybdopterin converting factor small subunit
MRVKIKILRGLLLKIVGNEEIIIETEKKVKVIDVLKILAKKYGEPFKNYVFKSKTKINSYLLLLKDGVNINTLKGPETQLEEGNELQILSAIGGG